MEGGQLICKTSSPLEISLLTPYFIEVHRAPDLDHVSWQAEVPPLQTEFTVRAADGMLPYVIFNFQ